MKKITDILFPLANLNQLIYMICLIVKSNDSQDYAAYSAILTNLFSKSFDAKTLERAIKKYEELFKFETKEIINQLTQLESLSKNQI